MLLTTGSSLWLAALGVLLAAVSYAMVPTMLTAWLGDLTSPAERGLVIGAYQTMGDVGAGIGPLAAARSWPRPACRRSAAQPIWRAGRRRAPALHR